MSARPAPDRTFVYVLCALYLCACGLFGWGMSQARFGSLRFSSNMIFGPRGPGCVGVIGPFHLTGEDDIEVIFSASHPRPHDAPPVFEFDWTLRAVSDAVAEELVGLSPPVPGSSGPPIVEGAIGFTQASLVAGLDRPPVARVPLPDALSGRFAIEVAPRAVSDWPDLEFYVVRANSRRGLAFIGAAIFGAVFVAFSVVAALRHRRALAAWRVAERAASAPP